MIDTKLGKNRRANFFSHELVRPTTGHPGQLLEARDPHGSLTRYSYDSEGNLIKKARWDV